VHRQSAVRMTVGVLGVGVVAAALRLSHVSNSTTVALAFLLVVLFVASLGDLAVAIFTSLAATLAFNFFFLPPVGTLTIADPHNWVALVAFLIVSSVASRLSATARARAREALERRNELTRLFDLTRDILLTTEESGALPAIARHVARRFELEMVAICVPGPEGWRVYQGGTSAPDIAAVDLDRAFASNAGILEFDARARAYGGHRDVGTAGGRITLAPVRVGGRLVALLATGGRPMEAGTRDAVAGIVAIAIERTRFMAERRGAELAKQRAELASALLASLSHDLRTPLTAIRTAVSNLDTPSIAEEPRREQARVAAEQLQRLTRLFDEILDMARIEAGTVQPRRSWTTPAEIVEAAVAHAAPVVAGHQVSVEAEEHHGVEVDPRLTASALAHLIENAVRYAGDGPICIKGWTDDQGLRLEVRDAGEGLQPGELERLFEPFYRGEMFRSQMPGTGMGLAITRGLVAADGGRVWAENLVPRGACFSIAVPGRTRPVANGVTT
jgi:two-component system, OmpR family, sensor histidine kinase KdpD